MIQFVGVSKFYGDIVAVEDVSLKVEEKEFIVLTGPSGSGKTTLMKMLIKDISPTQGKILVADKDITRLRRRKVYNLRRNIGVVFQDFKLLSYKTAYENVSFALEASGKSDKEIKEIVPYVLDIVGLKDRMKAFPYQLSGGQQQKIAIARAIANDPAILIADEPTGNLDYESTVEILDILRKINEWGTTVLMSTHGEDVIKRLRRRTIAMVDGKVVKDGVFHSMNDLVSNANTDSKSAIEESGDKKDEKKPKIKMGLSSKRKKKDKEEEIKEVSEDDLESKKEKQEEVGEEEKESKNDADSDKGDLKEYVDSDGTMEILKKNGYKNMQDVLNVGFGKIEMLEGVTGDQILEIKNAIKKYFSKEN